MVMFDSMAPLLGLLSGVALGLALVCLKSLRRLWRARRVLETLDPCWMPGFQRAAIKAVLGPRARGAHVIGHLDHAVDDHDGFWAYVPPAGPEPALLLSFDREGDGWRLLRRRPVADRLEAARLMAQELAAAPA